MVCNEKETSALGTIEGDDARSYDMHSTSIDHISKSAIVGEEEQEVVPEKFTEDKMSDSEWKMRSQNGEGYFVF